MTENNTKTKRPSIAGRIVFYFCVAGTLVMLAVCALFALYYFDNEADVKGRVVLLKGVEPPEPGASARDVRGWIKNYSDATPGCLCMLGSSATAPADEALLLCVGFSTGDEACGVRPEKLPAGVTMNSSVPSDISARKKIIFILDRVLAKEIVDPRTDTELETP